ncbi:MAG: hypothetical protein M1831_005807 [Alyxoria varia]|nr:MAG: hypothetical protein M1831_005807 [Alyxoria varia]
MSILYDRWRNLTPTVSDQDRFPEMFAINRRIDRKQCSRVVPMKVLVLGMCRTGTASMWEALKMLGFVDCYHMMNTMIDPNDNDMWLEAINGKYFGSKPFTRREWDMLLGHCQAVCDFPACAFPEELIKAYPDAKVILTNRNVDAWYTSCIGTIRVSMTSSLLYSMGFFDTEVMGKWTPMTRALFKGVFDDNFEKNGRAVFERQYATVRELVPKEQLLEFQMGEGWPRLCEFLNVEEPNVPYPNTNEAAAFRDRNWLRLKLAAKRGAPKIVATAATVIGVASWGVWYWRRRK